SVDRTSGRVGSLSSAPSKPLATLKERRRLLLPSPNRSRLLRTSVILLRGNLAIARFGWGGVGAGGCASGARWSRTPRPPTPYPNPNPPPQGGSEKSAVR